VSEHVQHQAAGKGGMMKGIGAVFARMTRSSALRLAVGVAIAATATGGRPWAPPAWAQANQFGGQQRADAAHEMIVLAVQRAISSLPPTSGQAITYEFDRARDTYVRGTTLGPTAFRSARTVGKGKIALRLATSYFELAESLGPSQYLVQFDEPFSSGELAGLQPTGVAGFGLDVSAKVFLLNLSATYGITNRIDLMLNLPISVVDAHASQPFSTRRSSLGVPLNESFVAGVFQDGPLSSDPKQRAIQIANLRKAFDQRISAGCTAGPDVCLGYRNESFTALGFSFNDGTHSGVGRISLGGKALLYSADWIRLAFMTELFFPSPNQEQFAGPDSTAILPRVIAGIPATDWLEGRRCPGAASRSISASVARSTIKESSGHRAWHTAAGKGRFRPVPSLTWKTISSATRWLISSAASKHA
jgi:hypothetical protein